MANTRKLEYATINGKKCERYKGTTTWQVCEAQS